MRDTVEHGCHGDGKLTCDFFWKLFATLKYLPER